MLPRGEWRPSAVGDGKTAGFHLSSLYSPVGWFTWAEAAGMFERAQKEQALLQVFVNTVLGETWTQVGEAPDWQRLYERREAYRIGTVPAGGLFVTAGCDVQQTRLEVEIIAWERDKQSWSVDYRVLEGDTSRPEVWERLSELLDETFVSEPGVALPIVKLAIDSGYATQQVYHWARKQHSPRVMVIKGVERGAAPVGLPTSVDVSVAGKRMRRGVRVWPVATGLIKEELYRWLRLEKPTEESGQPFPPGYCHLPRYPEEFFKQLTAEQLVTKVVKGYRRTEWQKLRERNESLDCRCYGRAAAAAYGLDRFTEKHWRALEEQLGVAAKRRQEPPALPSAVLAARPVAVRRVIRSPFMER
jgi:phage terminase large subunit GpA-like protein